MEFVQLEPYVRTLVQHLQQMYVMDEKQEIAIQFSMDPNIYLRFERIGTLGLIINEIVSNAFKYAFLEGPGVLRIDVQQVEGEVKMEIEDNGSGKVEEIRKNSNLGMRLILILSEQMGAQYVLQQSNGIKHFINFDV
jgi:two-component sensor histidine kinase